MRVELISPFGAVVGLVALLALVELRRSRRRSDVARQAIGLTRVRRGRVDGVGVAICSVAALVAVAAAQPVLVDTNRVPVRRDAAVYIVIDTSRSMLASREPGMQTRLERARRIAQIVRSELPGIKVGVASMSDRVLPHLLPSLDVASFDDTVAHVLRAGEPTPQGGGKTTSSLGALAALVQDNFFLASERRRAAVVISDFESIPFDQRHLARALRGPPGIALELVRIGGSGERVFDQRGKPELGYQPEPGAAALTRDVAAAVGGHTFGEHSADAAGRAVASALGREGKTTVVSHVTARRVLAPDALGLAALPLILLLLARNLPRGVGRRPVSAATLTAARRRSSAG